MCGCVKSYYDPGCHHTYIYVWCCLAGDGLRGVVVFRHADILLRLATDYKQTQCKLIVFKVSIHLCYKWAFIISGNPLLFNMATQWGHLGGGWWQCTGMYLMQWHVPESAMHWRILILLLPLRAATPEFPTTNNENDQIMASNNSLKFE